MLSLAQFLLGKVPLLLTVIICARLLYCILVSPLRRIPGPLAARLSRLWLAVEGYQGTFHSTLLSLHDTYGHTVRIGPGELSTVEPEAVKKIYGSFLTTWSV